MRVQIPAYTDHWMMDDRYGEVVRTGGYKNGRWAPDGTWTMAVKLDKSGRVFRFKGDDCTVID